MAATIQAEKTPAKATAMQRRALVIVLVVLAAHVIVLAALATFSTKPLAQPEPPKPIAVRFVQVTPPKQPEPQKPKLEKPKPQKPKELPKKQVKPKDMKVVEVQPKPKPASKPKTKPVLTTKTTSTQKQAVVLPALTDEEIKPKPEPETEVKPKPESKTETKSKPEPDPTPLTPPAPILVEGVSYIKPPRLSITERDLKGQARTVKLKINIGKTGKVEAVQVVSSSGINALDQKVASALKKATFTPHRVNGVAIPVYTIQPFELNLPNQ